MGRHGQARSNGQVWELPRWQGPSHTALGLVTRGVRAGYAGGSSWPDAVDGGTKREPRGLRISPSLAGVQSQGHALCYPRHGNASSRTWSKGSLRPGHWGRSPTKATIYHSLIPREAANPDTQACTERGVCLPRERGLCPIIPALESSSAERQASGP